MEKSSVVDLLLYRGSNPCDAFVTLVLDQRDGQYG